MIELWKLLLLPRHKYKCSIWCPTSRPLWGWKSCANNWLRSTPNRLTKRWMHYGKADSLTRNVFRNCEAHTSVHLITSAHTGSVPLCVGGSEKTQHFRPPFVTFNAQMARNSQTICNFAASNSKRKKIWQQQPQNNAQFIQ